MRIVSHRQATFFEDKRCYRCKQFKPLTEFYPSKFTPNGLTGECKACSNAQSRSWQARNPERVYLNMKRNMLQRVYGITLEEYEAMHAAQGGVCAICLEPETKTQRGKVILLAVDHDHQTGLVRQLLCQRCNRAIGLLRESPEIMHRAIVYLEKHRLV